MDYVSTRNKERKVSAAYAIANGIAPDGGLYCPTAFPTLTDADWKTLAESDYKGRSALILGKFLTDFTAEELADFASKAYADEKFGGADTAPVVKLGEGKNLLELWHGPTCAFKDMALQMLPHLLTASLRKTGETRTACILVATSGDTGKAALDGFHRSRQRLRLRNSLRREQQTMPPILRHKPHPHQALHRLRHARARHRQLVGQLHAPRRPVANGQQVARERRRQAVHFTAFARHPYAPAFRHDTLPNHVPRMSRSSASE